MTKIAIYKKFGKQLYVHSSIAIILMGKRELIVLLNLSSWCLVMVKRLFLEVPRGCLQFVIVVFPDHTHLLFQLSEKFADDSIYLATVQLPVKITDLWIYLRLAYTDMVVTENESMHLNKELSN